MQSPDWLLRPAALVLVLVVSCSNSDEEQEYGSGPVVNVSGIIKDQDGNPLANTRVMFNGPTPVEITTNEKGRFSDITPKGSTEIGIRAGMYDISAEVRNGKLWSTIEIKPGDKDLEIKMEPPAGDEE